MNSKFFYYILISINVVFLEDYNLSINNYNLNQNARNNTFTHLFGIMVEFQVDDNPETSGNGQFLSEASPDLTYINYPDINKCNYNSKLVIDLPPHNSDYFLLQMESVKNYYNSVSNGNIVFDNVILANSYQLSNSMSFYATSDQKIGRLFAEAMELASFDIENYINQNNSINTLNDILFVVFHAGLGQEASQDFDPTIYDIRSAYVDQSMLTEIQQNDYWINDNNIMNGLVMPETLNWIFYDVIEDLFPNTFVDIDELENLYCDIQIGMTGLFAHLLGYHFGFPVMSNVETGDTRIGKFGLMDVGWSNQAGIIPPRPNPWTRSNDNQNIFSWVTKNNQTDELYLLEELDLDIKSASDDIDEIIQISISENEYFLLENRLNRIEADGEYSNMSINDMINYYNPYDDDYSEEQDDFINLFDVIEHYSNLNGYDFFEIDPTYNVISKVKNYDYGLPGSGILIWHVDEPSINDYNSGVNNDLNNRSISLEEADGIEHLGNPNYNLFNDLSKGNKSDFWYLNNEFYQYINYGGYNNQNYLGEDILFNNASTPNTRLKQNIPSNLSIEIKDNISTNMGITIKYVSSDYDVLFIGDNIDIIGNSDGGCIFYIENNNIYEKCINQDSIQLLQDDLFYGSINSFTNESRILHDIDSNLFLVDDASFYIDQNGELLSNSIHPKGYYNNLNQMEEVYGALSLGDIDLDGYDEKLLIVNGDLLCLNSNESACNGFPVYGFFSGYPLIADILGDEKPEIICKNNGLISILDNEGSIIIDIPNYGYDKELSLVSNWGNTNSVALINGNRLMVFDDFNLNHSYWLNPMSNTMNNGIVSGPITRQGLEYTMEGIDLSKTYNYPNPISNGSTKFRFFVINSNYIKIKIYDAAGILIDTLDSNILNQNEYNELYWDASRFESGLYFAEIKSDLGESKLIKIVIL